MKRQPIYNAQFKTLVIRMLIEFVEYSHKLDEKMKAMKSEINQNIQGTNSEGMGTGTQINDLEQKEKKTFSQNRMKKQEFKKLGEAQEPPGQL